MFRSLRVLRRPVGAVVVSVALAVGCGGNVVVDTASGGSTGTGTTPDVACDLTIAGSHICYLYDNLSATQQSVALSACAAQGGVPVSACSTANLLGTCFLSDGGASGMAWYYATNGITAAIAQMACESDGGGTWTGA